MFLFIAAGEGSRLALQENVLSQDKFIEEMRHQMDIHLRQKKHTEAQVDRCKQKKLFDRSLISSIDLTHHESGDQGGMSAFN